MEEASNADPERDPEERQEHRIELYAKKSCIRGEIAFSKGRSFRCCKQGALFPNINITSNPVRCRGGAIPLPTHE